MTLTTPPVDTILAAALDAHGRSLTGDQYIAHVLALRQSAWINQHQAALRGPDQVTLPAPLLSDFVRDNDLAYIQLPQPASFWRAHRDRSASFWRGQLTRLDNQIQALLVPILKDRATLGVGGPGGRRTGTVQSRLDTRIARHALLHARHVHAQQMLAEMSDRATTIPA
ncbi:hypothetical protein [Rhodococcus sp. (in: high G+C Gram-positive bacteria)]|uniref:hypothetical protein n=1 Tax=Rhodococcus sp. TaxID=1831 RepID=UPI003B8A7D38